jgi:zeta toxin
MPLEDIRRNSYPQQDRADVQERVALAVSRDPESYIDLYNRDPRSFGGRYVCSDLFKETFAEYNASRDHRARYNAPVHNSAAVLASEQFHRLLHDNSDPRRNNAVFLTGIPGAGKTTFVLASGSIPSNVRVVYEGQLAKPETTIPKIQEAIDAGLKPLIYVVHTPAERALQNTLARFQAEGRGASLHVMAQIQSDLPSGLAAVQQHFGNTVELVVFDRRDTITIEKRGWDNLPGLAEGSYDAIKQRLTNELDHLRDAGAIDKAAYDQALGRALSEQLVLGRVDTERSQQAQRSGNTLSEGVLTPPRQRVALSLTEEQARLLLTAQHPSDAPAVARGMYQITNLDNSVSIMGDTATLSYDKDRQVFYAELDRENKPALLKQVDDVIRESRQLTRAQREPATAPDRAIKKDIEPDI